MIPICPTHGSPMRAGQKGGFYCPRKMPDQTYCTQRVKAAPAPQAIPGGPPEPLQGSGTSPRHLLVLAALDFAGKVYQGTGSDQGALGLAQAALHEFGTELL